MNVKERIRLKLGDITEMTTEAIVNAANNDLMLGGGVAGAISRKGGPSIQEECSRVGPVRVGEAAITGAGNLRCRHVIHAASMALGGRTTEANLRSSVAHALRLAREKKLRSIALPAVGAGFAGFPMRRCAAVMLAVAAEHLAAGTTLEEIWFVLFDPESYETFREVYEAL